MFSSTITLFNFDEPNDKYYSTLITNAELQPNYRTKFDYNRTEDTDISLLIIKYLVTGGEKQTYGNIKSFRTPKLWINLSSADKQIYFTFQEGRDFFAIGDFTAVTDIDYEVFKDANDGVFFIHEVKDFGDDLKHWEITGY